MFRLFPRIAIAILAFVMLGAAFGASHAHAQTITIIPPGAQAVLSDGTVINCPVGNLPCQVTTQIMAYNGPAAYAPYGLNTYPSGIYANQTYVNMCGYAIVYSCPLSSAFSSAPSWPTTYATYPTAFFAAGPTFGGCSFFCGGFGDFRRGWRGHGNGGLVESNETEPVCPVGQTEHEHGPFREACH